VILGDGHGSFGSATNSPTFGDTPHWVSIGDLNNDGIADLAVVNVYSNQLSIFMGIGGGALASVSNTALSDGPVSVLVRDVDGDGRPDVITSNLYAGSVSVMLNGHSIGTEPFGTGTPGCAGPHNLTGQGAPQVGNANYSLTCSKTPPLATGLLMITDAADAIGSDPFALGVKLHVDLYASTQLIALNPTSDASGIGTVSVPIPPYPFLVGSTFYGQELWVWPLNVCFNFPFGLSTSNGLKLTLLP
jgi:hypothetical protein